MSLAWFPSLALWSSLGLGVIQPESEPTAEDTFASCEVQMAQSPELYESASCFRALAACGGEIFFHEDYGLPDDRAPVVRYSVASVTKWLTAIAVLKLAEDGALALDDNLSKFFPTAPVDKADITVFQLLTHQSGFGQNYAADGKTSKEDA